MKLPPVHRGQTHCLQPRKRQQLSVTAFRTDCHEPSACVTAMVAVQVYGYDLDPKHDKYREFSHKFVPTYHLLIMLLTLPQIFLYSIASVLKHLFKSILLIRLPHQLYPAPSDCILSRPFSP